jgi:hypothetical protein
MSPPEPTPVCQNALACAQVMTFTDQTCPLAFPPASSYSNPNHFDLLNNHPQKTIVVHYQEKVRHLNSTRPDEALNKYVAVSAGQTAPLGCQRTPGLTTDQYDDWVYTLLDACFVSDTGCQIVPLPKPSKQRDPAKTCTALCMGGDQSCLKYSVTGAGPVDTQLKNALSAFSSALLNASPPANVSMSSLVSLSNIWSGSNTCSRGDLSIASPAPIDFPFSNSGSSCPVGFNLPNDTRASSVIVTFPGQLTGTIQMAQAAPRPRLTMAPSDNTHGPMLSIVELPANTTVYEPIIATFATGGELTFTGEKYYCAQIVWDK